MDERWYYRFFDQEIGPFDFQGLQALAAEGTIGKEDVVRTDTARAWVKARSIANLFPQSVSEDDLTVMLASQQSAAAPAPTPAARRPVSDRQDACYCLVMGRELGPMSFEELGDLARKGELTPQHKVRLHAGMNWIEAGSIVGLFESESSAGSADLASLMESAPAAEAADFELQRATPKPPAPSHVEPHAQPLQHHATHSLAERAAGGTPAERSEPKSGEHDAVVREWYWRVMDQETGPFDFESVFELAQSGRLAPTDELRRGRSGAWVKAETIVGLFPEESEELDDYDEEEEDDGFNFEDFLDDDDRRRVRRAKGASRGKPGRRDARHSGPRGQRKAARARAKAAARKSESRPETEAAPAADAAVPETATAPAQSLTPPAPVIPVPAPVPARPVPVRTKRSFSTGDSRINPRYVGIGAAVVVLGLALWKVGLPSFGGSGGFGGGITGETLAIWNEAVLLHQPEYEGPRWDEFKERALPRVNEIASELEKENKTDAESQLLLKVHHELLPAILEAGPTTTTKEWTEMTDCVKSLSS
jgi:GYF domain 2